MSTPFQVVCPACTAANRVARDRPAAQAVCGACRARLFMGRPIDVDGHELERHVASSDIPVLLDVWAPWCGPCRTMGPQFARAAARLEPAVRLLKLNADAAPDLVAHLGVRGVPALVLFRNGAVLARTAGARDAEAIVAWAEANLAAHSKEKL